MSYIKEIDQFFPGWFHVMDWTLTHNNLLLRCSEFVDGKNENLDVLFTLVRYMELPSWWENGIHIVNGDEADWAYIRTRYGGEIVEQYTHVYKILSEGRKYYIVAMALRIEKNNLGGMRPSLITGNRS